MRPAFIPCLLTKCSCLNAASFHAPSRPASGFAHYSDRTATHEKSQVVACILSNSKASRTHQPSCTLFAVASDRYSSSAVAKPNAASGIAKDRSPAAMHIFKGVIAAAL